MQSGLRHMDVNWHHLSADWHQAREDLCQMQSDLRHMDVNRRHPSPDRLKHVRVCAIQSLTCAKRF